MTTRASSVAGLFPQIDHGDPVAAVEIGGRSLKGEFYDAIKIPRAVVWHEFGVVSVKRRIVRETTIDKKILANQIRRERFRRLPIIPVPFGFAALNVGSSHKGFFHQWVDALPRAWVLGQVDAQIDDIVVSQKLAPEYREIAKRLTEREVTIRRVPRGVRLRTAAYLHLPVPFRQAPKGAPSGSRGLPTEYISSFRKHTADVLQLGGESGLRVFLSREHAATRRFANEQQVQTEMSALGFQIAHLERLTITQQARLFDGADVVVAQHGAGLTNLLHCRPGTKLVEIFHGPSGGAHALYRDLASQMGLDYKAVTLEGSGKDSEVSLSVDIVRDLL